MTNTKTNKEKNDKHPAPKIRKPNIYFSDSEANSLADIKNDVMTVIELMGPSSPKFKEYTSEAENDDSEICIKKSPEFPRQIIFEQPLVESSVSDTIKSIVSIREDTTSEKTETVCVKPPQNRNVLTLPPKRNFYQMYGYLKDDTVAFGNYNRPVATKSKSILIKNMLTKKRNAMQKWVKAKAKGLKNFSASDFYKMNIKHSQFIQHAPKRLVFDLITEFPKHKPKKTDAASQTKYARSSKKTQSVDQTAQLNEVKNYDNEYISNYNYGPYEHINPKTASRHSNQNINTNISNNPKNYNEANTKYFDLQCNCCHGFHEQGSYYNINKNTKVDVYYFDHGNSTYLRTTDRPPIAKTEIFAEKTEEFTTKFWAEIFGTFHIGFAFCTAFILQLFRFCLYAILRPLTIGMTQLASDYFFKPCLATLYNAIIQPPLIFLYNVFTSLRDLCDPIAEAIGYFLREFAVVVRAFRLVDIKHEKCCKPQIHKTNSNRHYFTV